MGRPLLTDEMIERANRGEDISGPPLHDEEETKILKQPEVSLVILLQLVASIKIRYKLM